MRKAVHLDELPYRRDSSEMFERIRELPGAALLDSSFPLSAAGRYDILTAGPVDQVAPPQVSSEDRSREFFKDLGRYHREHYAGIQPVSQDIPFCGGILGYIGYDFGNTLNGVGSRPSDLPTPANVIPAVHLQAYNWCVIQDHLLRRATLVCQPGVSPVVRGDLLARFRSEWAPQPADFSLTEKFASNLTETGYKAAFDRIQAYIQAGDCYQVNLAQRFSTHYRGDPWCAYRALRAVAAAPFRLTWHWLMATRSSASLRSASCHCMVTTWRLPPSRAPALDIVIPMRIARPSGIYVPRKRTGQKT